MNTAKDIIDTSVSTVSELLELGMKNSPTTALLNDWTGKSWKTLSYYEFYETVHKIAYSMQSLKLEPQAKIAVFLSNNSRFCLYDVAISLAGFVSVPLHLTFNDQSISYVLQHSDASLCIVNGKEQYNRLKALQPEMRFILSDEEVPGELYGPQLIANAQETQLPESTGESPLTIIYTSGTTGQPKGVLLEHKNLITLNSIIVADLDDCIKKHDREISFLPLSHIFAKSAIYRWLYHGTSVYFTNPDQIMMHIAMVKPQTFSTVPHLLEKIYLHIANGAENNPQVDPEIYNKAFEFAHVYDASNPEHQVMHQAFSPIYQAWQNIFGGELTFICSGGAHLRTELCRFLNNAGIPILEGYGMTEAPVISVNPFRAPKPGTAGRAFSETNIKIAEDGEILVSGPQIMETYYKDAEATDDVLKDGWLHTGDIGYLDDEGYLFITDRKKNIFKMSTGKFVIPTPLETALKADPFIAHALVIGEDKRFCSALIFPEITLLPRFAKKLQHDTIDVHAICQSPQLTAYYQQRIDQANEQLPKWSQIKKFKIIHEELSPLNGLLTATLKVKRKAVKINYDHIIQEIYQK
ncbi:putative acyl-CoA synthetase, long-chain-fatty acid:CoA ligase [Lentisphaera araneosa HTCC2155]|uniref:Putative acyl-CoA synthetase, long-chain-fatty acid:CoA ligase n=1 Tax=Lentisphaera araneosa HTCC2155 TaxID=313628 RepID=A6DTH2_9BACT|nr:AMP-dependent synthetase/ligase [Lentisphaera araneosa]EDM25076.1 putative acyl-CoA synthetase, long-chain-fatty acid:CoA ligase [Lentisphaera araneosa HTCC2155]